MNELAVIHSLHELQYFPPSKAEHRIQLLAGALVKAYRGLTEATGLFEYEVEMAGYARAIREALGLSKPGGGDEVLAKSRRGFSCLGGSCHGGSC